MLKDFSTCKNSSFITPYKLLLDFGDSKQQTPLVDVKYKKHEVTPTNKKVQHHVKEIEKQHSHSNNSNSKSFKDSNLLSKLNDFSHEQPRKQGFKLSHMMGQVEEQNKVIKEQQNQINYKMFYSHFDDSYKDIMEYISQEQIENQQNSTEKQGLPLSTKPRFKKVTTIRPEILFNIKQLIRMQRIRAEKIYKEEIKPDEMIEYMKKRNQIEIIFENSKKIKNLKVVADLIEKEIEIQNEKINDLVQKLIIKFGLESYHDEGEREKLQFISMN